MSATPVVYTGDIPTDLPSDAEPIDFQTLRDAAPALRSGLPTETCGEPVPIDLAAIESAMLYGELERAEEAASAAVAWAPCAELSPLELSALMRTWGLVAAHTGGPALQRFTIARTLFPSMAWDERFAPRYRQDFDLAEAPFADTFLTVLPAVEVQIDAQPPPLNLLVGRHMVSIGSVGAWVELLDAPDTLVIPSAFPADALSWMAQEARREELTALFAVTLGEGERAMVHHNGLLWEGTTGGIDWVRLTDPTPVASNDPVPPQRRRSPGVLVAISGGVLTAVGLGLSGGGYSMASQNAEPRPSMSSSDRESRYNMGRTLSQLGVGLTIGGGLVTGTGVTWSVLGTP